MNPFTKRRTAAPVAEPTVPVVETPPVVDLPPDPFPSRIKIPERIALERAVLAHGEIEDRLRANADLIAAVQEVEAQAKALHGAVVEKFTDAVTNGGDLTAIRAEMKLAAEAKEEAGLRVLGLQRRRAQIEAELQPSADAVAQAVSTWKNAEQELLTNWFETACSKFEAELEQIYRESAHVAPRLLVAIRGIRITGPGGKRMLNFSQRVEDSEEVSPLILAAGRVERQAENRRRGEEFTELVEPEPVVVEPVEAQAEVVT